MSIASKPLANGEVFNINNFISDSSSLSNLTISQQTVTNDEYVGGDATVEGDCVVNGNINFAGESPAITQPTQDYHLSSNQLTTKQYVDNLVNYDAFPQVLRGGKCSFDKNYIDNVAITNTPPTVPLTNFSFLVTFKNDRQVECVDITFETNLSYNEYTSSATGTIRSSIMRSTYRFWVFKAPTSIKYLYLDGDIMMMNDEDANTVGQGMISCGLFANKLKVMIYFKNSNQSLPTTFQFGQNFISSYGFGATIVSNFESVLDSNATDVNSYFSSYTIIT